MSSSTNCSRREFSKVLLAAGATVAFPAVRRASAADSDEPLFRISLAEWSLHKALFAGKIDHLDFAGYAKQCGIEAVEYVNQFFKDKAKDREYIAQMKRRAEDAGVRSLLIMCDGEGRLGDPSLPARQRAVENHYKWVEAAKELGCHSIRVNAASEGSYQDQLYRAADGLRALTEFAAPHEISVLVENHGGLSSNGRWLAEVMTLVNLPHCGTLPDFGNFQVAQDEQYNRYKGVLELMPFAKAVSAKSHDFSEQGDEIHTDYLMMMKIVLAAGYRGYVGVEYEGSKLSEDDGIRATKKLLERVRDQLA
jgi:sugar phosphate isomerase/epimerase